MTIEQDELVGRAIVLYAMHFFMTQIPLFTNDSAVALIRSLSHPTKLSYTPNLTSRLLNLQIKQVMYNLVYKTTGDVLRDLENAILPANSAANNNNRAAWTTSFCVISILCMCVEMVQTATDFRIVYLMTEEGRVGLSRADSMNDDRERPISHSIEMFHLAFKSYKRNGSRKNERGFNPIRYGLEMYNEHGLDQAAVDLIDEIRQVLAEHGIFALSRQSLNKCSNFYRR